MELNPLGCSHAQATLPSMRARSNGLLRQGAIPQLIVPFTVSPYWQ